eukprot:314751_1
MATNEVQPSQNWDEILAAFSDEVITKSSPKMALQKCDKVNEQCDKFTMIITPNSGLWMGIKCNFEFTIHSKYPNISPNIYCVTNVFHPCINYTNKNVYLKVLKKTTNMTEIMRELLWIMHGLFTEYLQSISIMYSYVNINAIYLSQNIPIDIIHLIGKYSIDIQETQDLNKYECIIKPTHLASKIFKTDPVLFQKLTYACTKDETLFQNMHNMDLNSLRSIVSKQQLLY